MSDLALLSDTELDAVSGGGVIVLAAGPGGAGGTALVGGQLVAAGSLVVLSNVNMSVSHSTASANGGNGGNIRIHR